MAELYSLPNGWEWKKLDDITELITKGTTPTTNGYKFQNSGINFLKIENIVNGEIDLSTIEMFISEEAHQSQKRSQLQENDVLFSIAGTIGDTAIVKKEHLPMNINQAIALIRPKNILNTFFLKYSLLSIISQNTKDKQRGGAIKNISLGDIKDLNYPLPPLEEQKRIVAKLDILFAKIDKAIALHQKNIDEANVFMASVLNNVFVELEEKYKYTKLKNAVTKEKTSIKRGPFGSALKKSFFVEKGYLVYEQYHALNNDFSMERYYIDENKFNELKGFEVKAGDIIISCSGAYLGKLAIIPNDFTKGIINQALLKLSLNKNIIINELFVYFWNNLMNNGFFDEVKKGAAIPNMPAVKELKEINIPLPELPIQQKVVSYLDEISQKMEKIKQIQKEKMQSLKALKASILDQAFKGEL